MSGRFKILSASLLAAVSFAAPASAADGGAVVNWTEYLRAVWPVILTVVGLLATGALLALATRFASIAAFDKLKVRVSSLEDDRLRHGARIHSLEEHCAASPTRQELQEDISELGERMKGVEAELGGMRDQLRTTNQYLHTLIERGLNTK